jgi:hypothetical protein
LNNPFDHLNITHFLPKGKAFLAVCVILPFAPLPRFSRVNEKKWERGLLVRDVRVG